MLVSAEPVGQLRVVPDDAAMPLNTSSVHLEELLRFTLLSKGTGAPSPRTGHSLDDVPNDAPYINISGESSITEPAYGASVSAASDPELQR